MTPPQTPGARTRSRPENGELTAAYLTDGKWGILLKLGGGDSPTPGDEDIYVPYGTNEAISSLDKRFTCWAARWM